MSDAQTTAASTGAASSRPRVTSWPQLADLKSYYPPDADGQDIGGMVLMQVTLDRHACPTDALVLAEDPPDMGFGAAACALAYVMEYSNPAGQSTRRSRRRTREGPGGRCYDPTLRCAARASGPSAVTRMSASATTARVHERMCA